jgi:hypothetical protein
MYPHLGIICFAVLLAPTPAQEKPLPLEFQKAMDRGVAYLKSLQKPDGSWPHDRKGATPLAAWTLLECDVSPNDPIIQKAAAYTRDFILTSDRTYEIALAIMLFDRLGDPEDLPLIESLAVQLLAGQNAHHGWSYDCPPLPQAELAYLRDHLAKQKEKPAPKLPEQRPPQKPRDPKLVHESAMKLAQILNQAPLPRPIPGLQDEADNSNTQFALLALWVARRNGMPIDKALERVAVRFRATQHKSGGWPYDNRPFGPDQKPSQPTATMTAAGLLALAAANGLTLDKGVKQDFNKDPVVTAGLVAVSVSIGEPGQPRDKLLLANPGRSYYFLWTLERMAVIYNLKTIGGKDWHRWGVELILANQQADGSWRGEFADGGCDTCFALLFLRKANIAEDLTARFGLQMRDPGAVPARLLDLIASEVQPGIENKQAPKK